MKRTIERLRAALGVPAVAAAVVGPDGETSFAAAGVRAVGSAAPVTRDTSFAIGSVTKLLTAALVLRLVERGELALDDPCVAAAPVVTVRMLLDHTSGLRSTTDDPALAALVAADPDARWTPERTLAYAHAPPYFGPGRGWRYSNTNYLLLGDLVERTTGSSAGTALRRLLLGPCGIGGIDLQDGDPPPGPLAHAHVAGGDGWADVTGRSRFVPFRADATSAWTAGGAAARLPDLARFVHALFGGRVLQPASLAELVAFRPRTTSAGSTLHYGLGTMRLSLGGREAWGHTGGITGSKATALYLPRERVALALAWNAARPADPVRVAEAITKSTTKVFNSG